MKNNAKPGGASAASARINLTLGSIEKKRGKHKRNPWAGGSCPQCQQGTLDYDGLLNLSCPQCGYALSGCFT